MAHLGQVTRPPSSIMNPKQPSEYDFSRLVYPPSRQSSAAPVLHGSGGDPSTIMTDVQISWYLKLSQEMEG